MQIKNSTISRIATPYRGTCRGAARRIASLTALDGPSMRTKPLCGHTRLLASPSRVMSSCSFFDRGAGVIVAGWHSSHDDLVLAECLLQIALQGSLTLASCLVGAIILGARKTGAECRIYRSAVLCFFEVELSSSSCCAAPPFTPISSMRAILRFTIFAPRAAVSTFAFLASRNMRRSSSWI